MKDMVNTLTEHVENYSDTLRHNHELFNVYEGELLPLVAKSLQQHLSPQVFEQMVSRISPINVLIKIIDKLSKIYQQDPSRVVLDSTNEVSDTELLRYYERCYRMNNTMNVSNESFNLYKNNLLQPYVHKGKPRLRSIASDRFLPYSNDPVDPLTPTHMILIQGVDEQKDRRENQKDKIIYHAYSSEEFLIFDSNGDIRIDLMTEIGNPEGINPIGRLPFTYVNRSKNLLIPKVDTDTLKMTVLIPILLSDLNLAAMYQAFSILYGINVDDEDLVIAPNAFWRFKSDGTAEGNPEVGSIKPETDIESVLKLIQTQLAFWLQSKGIRPGALGSLSTENMASGISKMVDEMDTSEDRKKQVGYFDPAEDDLWDLTTNYMHPYWVSTGQIDPMPLFTPTARVETNFAQQVPLLNRKQVIEEVVLEMDNGLLSKREAIARLDPHLTEEEIDERLAKADEDKTSLREFLLNEETEESQETEESGQE